MIKSIIFLLIGILFVDAAVVTVSFIQQIGSLNEAKEKILVLESHITSLSEERLSLRGRASILQSQLAESEGKLSALQERLKTSEITATNLQEQVTNTKAAINRVPVVGVEPAAFKVVDLLINPDKMQAGNIVTVAATVANTGGQTGTYRVILSVREYSLEHYEDRGEDVTLAPGESRDVTFRIALFDKGHYVLSAGQVLGDLEVI